mmetsp:Transcript_67649/g.198005  ORF Transcript_67649/g.198005 Transcript_67649/m.198005 type:complete len:590 (-) Transcript_67649:87-1856(-)
MGPKTKAKSKAKGKVADKQMQALKASEKKKQELLRQQELIMQEKAVLVIQRFARGFRARRSFAAALALEDHVLRVPTPPHQAAALLMGEPGHPPPDPVHEGQVGSPLGDVGASEPLRSAGTPQSTSKRQASSSKSSGRRSSRSPPSRGNEIGVPEDKVARHLEAALPDSRYTASMILWLLSAKSLSTRHLRCIFWHHELRRKNANQQVRVRLVLMQHGDSSRLPLSPTGDSSVGGGQYPKRTLLPEGWMQVTRTSWSLRLHPEFQPHLICSSSVPCCIETAERVLKVIEDEDDDTEIGSGNNALDPAAADSSEQVGASQIDLKRPSMHVCGALDLQPISSSIGPAIHRIAEAVGVAVQELPVPAIKDGLLPPPFVLMLVAGGTVLEAVLACLCSEGKRELCTRLGGGDIVMLESQPMMRVVSKAKQETEGEDEEQKKREPQESTEAKEQTKESAEAKGQTKEQTEQTEQNEDVEEEIVRPIHEVWHDAVLRNQWKVSHHVRGQDWSTNFQTTDDLKNDVREPKLGATWRSYAGEPLILSHGEFTQLCRRAGSTLMPLPAEMSTTLRPLVRDHRKKPQHRAGHTYRVAAK